MIRPSHLAGQEYTGLLTEKSGVTFKVISDYIYKEGDIIEGVFHHTVELSSRYLKINTQGVVTGTSTVDPGFVDVGPSTNQTLTFPAILFSPLIKRNADIKTSAVVFCESVR